MGALEQAQGHLSKAQEFLEASELTLDLGMFDAATSSEGLVAPARRRSSAIMSRHRWLARRRLRQRIASLRLLPSAILVSK